MQNVEKWLPTKFAKTADGWTASPDPRHLAPTSRLTSELALRSYVAALERHATGHLADMGCGTAPLYGVYSQFTEQVTCIDWPGSNHSSSYVDVFADLNQELDVPDDSFDTILSTSVLEHIWSHEILWRETARIMKPEGKLILGTPFLYWLHEEPHDFFRWSPHALRAAAEANGLTVISLEPYGGGIDAGLDLLLKMIGARHRRLGRVAAKLVFRLFSKGALRRLADRNVDKMPLGYLLVAQKR